jgi:hypothetical protein
MTDTLTPQETQAPAHGAPPGPFFESEVERARRGTVLGTLAQVAAWSLALMPYQRKALGLVAEMAYRRTALMLGQRDDERERAFMLAGAEAALRHLCASLGVPPALMGEAASGDDGPALEGAVLALLRPCRVWRVALFDGTVREVPELETRPHPQDAACAQWRVRGPYVVKLDARDEELWRNTPRWAVSSWTRFNGLDVEAFVPPADEVQVARLWERFRVAAAGLT